MAMKADNDVGFFCPSDYKYYDISNGESWRFDADSCGSTPSCVFPVDGDTYVSDTTLCSGSYYMPATSGTALLIGASDMTLDCSGSTIIGSDTNDGIESTSDRDNVVI